MASSSSSSLFSFGGEAYLRYQLPHHDRERMVLGSLMCLSAVFWWLIVPFLVGTFLLQAPTNSSTTTTTTTTTTKRTLSSSTTRTRTTVVISSSSSSRKVVTNGKKKKKKKNNDGTTTNNDDNKASVSSSSAGGHASGWWLTLSNLIEVIGFLASILWLLSRSSSNNLVPRGVWEAPLLTLDECQTVLDMAHAAAQRNYQQAVDNNNNESSSSSSLLLDEPVGWQKKRHASYPTTDLNLVTDPFTPQDRAWLETILHQRLSPLLQRVYGVVPKAIRANDMFVVRYDAEKQPYLSKHTDDSDISFNVLLTNGFEGGGTRFWNRLLSSPFATVQPTEVGRVLTHSALIQHEGLPITSGLRYILVGFLAVDRIEPHHPHRPTGLSWFASWGSIPYTHNKLKEGYTASHSRLEQKQKNNAAAASSRWTDDKHVRSVFLFLVVQLQWIGDTLCPHRHYNLVEEQFTSEYLSSLDQSPPNRDASWFENQQLNLDVDGTVASDWTHKRQPQQQQQQQDGESSSSSADL